MLNPISKILQFTASTAMVVGLLAGCGSGADSPKTQPFFPAAEDEWQMVWSDEFDGDALDLSNWDIQTGDGSEFGLERWGNNEQQWYTADSLTVADGFLTITAAATPVAGANVGAQNEIPPGFPYTSGRIRTAEKFDFTYGRVEARVQAAPGQGLWSAAWMLPTDSPYTTWAAIGEVDIMEVVNADTDRERVFQTLHYGFPWPLNQQTGLDIEDLDDPAGEFHVYAVEWSDKEMRWYIDDVHYLTVTSDTWYTYYYADQQTGYKAGDGAAPFNVDFHVLLNLAVGGNLPGEVDPAAVPTQMVVDYVRVYSCSYDEPGGIGCNSNADRTLDTADPQEPFEDSFDLYVDGAAALEWTIAGETVSRQLAVNSFWDNDGALTFSEVDSGDPARGTVIDVMTSNSGNISINAVDGEVTSLFGMGNNPNYWELHAAELKFDLYVDSASTDPDSSIFIKMDSGYPAVGQAELKVADLPADTWTTISVQVNELLASHVDNDVLQPLNTGAIVSFFVLEPTAAAHVQVGNIELACGHPAPRGCGILPPGGAVEGDLVEVFIDAVNPLWTNGIGAWDDETGQDYFNGNSARHVTWNVYDTGDPEHNEVIQVNFGTGGANGLLFIQAAAGVDLTTLTDGFLIFDLRLEAGSTHGVTFKVDCFFPCGTGDLELDLSGTTRGEWTTYEIPVSSLIAAGLDITTVNSPIVIFPTWGQQQGVSFELDNIRYEVPDDVPTGPPTFAGTWRMAPEAGSLGVGPVAGDVGWFACDEACVQQRACYFDDDYVFGTDGTFDNVLGDETWIEGWQGGSDACGTPVFPHDGSAEASWEYDENAGTLTINGAGAYIGLPKATNDGEIDNPNLAPSSITYTVEVLDRTTATLYIEAGTGVFWNYKLVKVAEPPPPPPFVGTWRMAPEAGSLGVGPEPGDVGWFACDATCVQLRACYFDDDYVMSADGTFRNVLGDETWIEGWQGGSDACGTPVFPHDGVGEATWEYDESAGTLTVFGTGAYIGLPKAVNTGELASPSEAPSSVTYQVDSVDSDNASLSIEAGGGVWWQYKLINTE